MDSLPQMIPGIFRQAWLRYGQPVLSAIRPPEDWNLPSGFYGDLSWDDIRDASGTSLLNVEDYWTRDAVDFVPAGRGANLSVLTAAGIVPSGSTEVLVLAADIAKLQNAFAVQIGDQWYNVDDVANAPLGTTSLWARVRLSRRS